MRREIELNGREVPDSVDAGVDERIGDGLGMRSRNGDDADRDIALMDDEFEIFDVGDGDAADGGADDIVVIIEERVELETELREIVVIGESGTEMTDADDSHMPMPMKAENFADVQGKFAGEVADTFHAELTEESEVFADLNRSDVEFTGEFTGGDDLNALVLKSLKRTEIKSESADSSLRNHEKILLVI